MSRFNNLRPHAEERPQGRFPKHDAKTTPFETARSAPPQGEVCEVAL